MMKKMDSDIAKETQNANKINNAINKTLLRNTEIERNSKLHVYKVMSHLQHYKQSKHGQGNLSPNVGWT